MCRVVVTLLSVNVWGDEWKRCVREWKEVFSRLMYVRMNVGESEYVCLSGCEV